MNVGVHLRAQDMLHPLHNRDKDLVQYLAEKGLHLGDKIKGMTKELFDSSTPEDFKSCGFSSAEIDIITKSRSVSSHLDA
jgi:hypothetical protein